jgi:N-acetylmuramoyl-L-alanine amidase
MIQMFLFHVINGEDGFMGLQERVQAINAINPDLVISIHVNAERGGEDASGMEFFVTDKPGHFEKSNELAEKLAAKFKTDTSFKVRKVAQAPFYVLKNVNAPAIMFQMGYLTNKHDRTYMTNEEMQKVIATRIADFIKEAK